MTSVSTYEADASSKDEVLRLAAKAKPETDRKYYPAVADAIITSYGHPLNVARILRGER